MQRGLNGGVMQCAGLGAVGIPGTSDVYRMFPLQEGRIDLEGVDLRCAMRAEARKQQRCG
jgi:hypothetical protein